MFSCCITVSCHGNGLNALSLTDILHDISDPGQPLHFLFILLFNLFLYFVDTVLYCVVGFVSVFNVKPDSCCINTAVLFWLEKVK